MSIKPDKNILRFRRLGVISIIAVYLLIFVGGVVRSTGSGMGCPDWPKCFGQWVPPLVESELPENFKEIYSEKRRIKNEKLATTLSAFGAKSSAKMILGDESTYTEDDFNATKTWVEYINRLIGAFIGILLFALFLSAIPLIRIEKSFATFSGLIVIVTGFQGWLGSIVVSTKLLPGMITIHMLLALLIIASLIAVVFSSYGNIVKDKPLKTMSSLRYVFLIMLLALIPQIVLGTEVRESIDILSKQMGLEMRSNWVDSLGLSFYIHRSFSWVFLALSIYSFYKVYKVYTSKSLEFRAITALMVLVVLEILLGVGMANFGVPPVFQPFHLLFGTGLFGLVLFLFLMASRVRQNYLENE